MASTDFKYTSHFVNAKHIFKRAHNADVNCTQPKRLIGNGLCHLFIIFFFKAAATAVHKIFTNDILPSPSVANLVFSDFHRMRYKMWIKFSPQPNQLFFSQLWLQLNTFVNECSVYLCLAAVVTTHAIELTHVFAIVRNSLRHDDS